MIEGQGRGGRKQVAMSMKGCYLALRPMRKNKSKHILQSVEKLDKKKKCVFDLKKLFIIISFQYQVPKFSKFLCTVDANGQ